MRHSKCNSKKNIQFLTELLQQDQKDIFVILKLDNVDHDGVFGLNERNILFDDEWTEDIQINEHISSGDTWMRGHLSFEDSD